MSKPTVPADRLHECRACGVPFITAGDYQRDRWKLPEGCTRGVKSTMLCGRDHHRVQRHGAPVTIITRAPELLEDLGELLDQGYSWDRAVDRLADAKGVERDSVLTTLRRARRRGLPVPAAVAA